MSGDDASVLFWGVAMIVVAIFAFGSGIEARDRWRDWRARRSSDPHWKLR